MPLLTLAPRLDGGFVDAKGWPAAAAHLITARHLRSCDWLSVRAPGATLRQWWGGLWREGRPSGSRGARRFAWERLEQPGSPCDGQPLLLHPQRGRVDHLIINHQRADALLRVGASVGVQDVTRTRDLLSRW